MEIESKQQILERRKEIGRELVEMLKKIRLCYVSVFKTT